VQGEPQPKPTRQRSYPPDFEAAWEAFGRYGAKPRALDYWRHLAETDRQAVVAAIPGYLACVTAGRAKKQFEGWINPQNRLWEMDWAAVLGELTRPLPARAVENRQRISTGIDIMAIEK